MALTDHQLSVIKYLKTVKTATKLEIYDNINFGYFYNWQTHFGAVLSRMIKKKYIERVKTGVYKIALKTQLPIENGLFNNPK